MKFNWKSRKIRRLCILALFAVAYEVASYAGWIHMLPAAAERPLSEATQATLYSLGGPSRFNPGFDDYRGYAVLGKTELSGAQARKAIGAFHDAASSLFALAPWRLECFEPHHALRINFEGHRYDYLLCYTCDAIAVDRDGKEIAYQNARGSPDTLNELLSAAHVHLIPKYAPRSRD